jgi:peptidoglycan/LPS O-acetylase OafA/YrhL
MKSHNRLYEFDALRGIAAVSVCLFHFSLFKYGCVGVDLFFIISGFVIFMSILNAKSVKEFWLSRFIRLYPSYWLSIVVAVGCALIFHKPTIVINASNVIGNITMLQPIFKSVYVSGVYWTLYVEMLFYIVITILWYCNLLKNIELAILIGLVCVISINGLYLLCGTNSQFVHYYIIIRSLVPLLNHLQFFSAGIRFYLIYSNGISIKRVLLLLLTLFATAISHKNSVMINSFLNVTEHLVCDSVVYAAFILIIYGWSSMLRLETLMWFGHISYPLYLIHSSFGISFKERLINLNLVGSTAIALLSTISLSYIITYYYDVPIRRYLKRSQFKIQR